MMPAAPRDLLVDGCGEDIDRLKVLRAQLDALNQRLLETLEARGRIVQEVMAIKERTRLPRHDPRREAEMIASLLGSSSTVYPEDALRGIFESIFKASRQITAADTSGDHPPADAVR